MVKTPRTRHSKGQRAPVTIELGSEDVKRVDETVAQAAADPFEPVESIEMPAQPEAELLKVEGEPAPSETSPGEPDNSQPESSEVPEGPSNRSEYEFGRNETEATAGQRQSRAVPASNRGGMSNIAAGLIGAVLALGGFYWLQASGVLGTSGGGAVSLVPVESQIADLKTEIEALRATPANDSGAAAELDKLKSEVAALQSSVGSGGGGDGAAVAALDERLKKIEAAPTASQTINDQLTALESKVSEAAGSVGANDARIAALEQAITALTGKVDQQASQPKVALAIAATALKSAVDRGGPFAAEAESFAAIAPNAPELAGLRQYAEQGVATQADLIAAFPQAADAMMVAATPEDPNAGILQRLMDSAQSVVKVRPVGSQTGDDPGARIARMEVALGAGDLAKAMAEFDGLPDAVKQAGAGLADRIKARIEVTKLVDQLVAGAMKSA